jgi:hypothetical protein
MKIINKASTGLLLTGLLLGNIANAAIISDYSKIDSVNDNWGIVYQGGYGETFDYATLLNSLAPGSTVALASSSSDGSLTFDLFAATDLSILQTITAYNSTLWSDGAYWYRNSSSVGFSLGSQISQSSADITGIFSADDGTADFDISWHGGLTDVEGGWRSGLTSGLNYDNIWQRYVLVDSGPASVPEPSTLAIFALGMIGLASRRFKKQS